MPEDSKAPREESKVYEDFLKDLELENLPSTAISEELREKFIGQLDDIYRAALFVTDNEQEAEDLVQETMLKAFRFAHAYQQDTNLRSWLFRILNTSAINRYRKKAFHPTTSLPEGEDFYLYNRIKDLSGQELSGIAGKYVLSKYISKDELKKALHDLPLNFRFPLILADIFGFSYTEIAEALQIPSGTVMSRISRARHRLQRSLWQHLTEKDINLASAISIRITEEPLTPQNLALTFTSLTELTTKFWLIAKHRFADLIEYTQTHDTQFAYGAGTTITWIRYNSPFGMGIQVDRVVPGVAEATITLVDGLSQRKAKLQKLELENQAAAQKIKEAEQTLEQQQQLASLHYEKQKLEIEKERQAFVGQRLEMQKKQIEDALELASKAVEIVYPNADAEMRPVLIQTVMNNILQLQNVNGLELALPEPKNN